MAKFDRNNYKDAKFVFEKLLPNSKTRYKVIEFLEEAISYADTLNSDKWNLNLDLDGNFIRFNVGHEYCIEIDKQRILIICNRIILKPKLNNNIPVIFLGHIKKEKYYSTNINDVPDCLAKTKNSIGCILKISDIESNIDIFKESNFNFIKSAVKTFHLPRMKTAHSQGAIKYLSQELDKVVCNPIYIHSNLPTINKVIEDEVLKLNKAKSISKQKRKEILAKSNPKPTKTIVIQVVFNRNQYVVAEVLDRANGYCERCNKPAPFHKDTDNKPYLEVHHIIPLAENGDDTIDNAIALCPNCHRQAHFGKKTY